MSTKRSKTWTERAQEMFGVTKNELMVATMILILTLSSLVYRWIANPADPLDQKLNAQLAHLIDSITAARNAAEKLQGDSSLVPVDTSAQRSYPQFKAPSQYDKKAPPTKPLNINTAGKEELMRLPGVGQKMAERIIEHRTKTKFKRIEDLLSIRGIGGKKFEKMKVYIMTD